MKTVKILLLMLAAVFCLPAFSQLAMELNSNQTHYMQYESIYMHLRIRNDSGRPMVFGKNEKLTAKLYFEIADVRGRIIEEYEPKAILLARGKVINPGQTGDIILKFSKIYNLAKTGIYRIHAYISHPMLKDQFRSNDVRIEISDGVKIWSRTIGVPDGVIGNDGRVLSRDSSRTYSIKKLNTNDIQYYYCTLEDKDKMYQTFRMGPVLGIEKPECIIDMSGALHTLVYILPKIYKYYKVDISGALVDDGKYYKTTKTTPHLMKNSNGQIFVGGGAPAVPNVDFAVREKSFSALDE